MRGSLAAAITACLVLTGTASAQETGYSLSIRFDAGSAAKLARLGERVIVAAWYYGEPTAAGRRHADEMGLVNIGREEAEIWPVNQTVTLGGALRGAPLTWVTEPMVNVNVYSARIADENNLLNCSLVDEPLAEARRAVSRIDCALIYPD